jgi:hypothetical protein
LKAFPTAGGSTGSWNKTSTSSHGQIERAPTLRHQPRQITAHARRYSLCHRCASSPSSVSPAGAPGGSRTPNLLIRSQMLYPLSYRRSLPAYRRGPALHERGALSTTARSGSDRLGSDEELGPPVSVGFASRTSRGRWRVGSLGERGTTGHESGPSGLPSRVDCGTCRSATRAHRTRDRPDRRRTQP